MIDIVLFDFDQTLVDSRPLSALREFGAWAEVAKGIPALKLYAGIQDTLTYLAAAKTKVGIVSNSPRDVYVAPACKQLGINPDIIIGYHEVTRRKPQPEPYLAAVAALLGKTYADPAAQTAAIKAAGSNYKFLRSLGVYPDRVLVVGDNSNDIRAAGQIFVSAVGALWGADDRDEVILAQPDYLCDAATELIALIDDLRHRRFGVKRGEAWSAKAKQEYASRVKTWTKLDTSATGPRAFLKGNEETYHLRRRHKGSWSLSFTNGLVSNFKSEETSGVAIAFKKQAAEQFATELALFMEASARYTFVPPSKRRDDPAFDARNDLVVAKLGELRADLRYVEPVTLVASREKASATDNPALRDPDNIIANYVWDAEGWQDGGTLYIIDDVLTKGGHMKATERYIRANGGPATRLVCLSWALHC